MTHHIIIHIHHVLLFIPKVIRTILPFVIVSWKSTGVVIFTLMRQGWAHVVVFIVAVVVVVSTGTAAAVNVH